MLDLIKGAGRTSAEQLKYTQIKTNGGTQMRAGLNQETVGEYADAMRHNEGYAGFPPIIVYFDGADYWLGDGFHRHAAAFQAFGSSCTIPAEVRAGTRRDAILHAAGANNEHGLRRTAADKRRAVETLLTDDEWRAWSNYKIAETCRVSEAFVRKIKAELNIETTHETQYIHPRTGQPTTMNTQKIGQSDLSAKIHKLEVWLMGKGWSMSSGLGIPTSINKGEHRFEWNRNDEKAHFSALKNAETIQIAISNLDNQITRLSTSLIAAGWGILSAPPPAQSYVMDHKTKERFNFDRGNRQSLLDALLKAENAQKLYHLRHAFDDADPAPAAHDTPSQEAADQSSTARIRQLTLSLVAKDWGMSSSSMSTTVSIVKGSISFSWDDGDEKSHLDALKSAENRQIIEEMAAREEKPAPALEPSHPSPTSIEASQSLTTLDAAVRRATCIYVGDQEQWQALAATGADYWQILDLLKSKITSSGGTSGPGGYSIEWRSGPIVTIYQCVGGPVVAKLMSGRLVEAVRRAWAIPERAHTPTEDTTGETVATAEPPAPSTPLRETSRALLNGSADDRLFLAKSILRTIAVTLDDLPVYGELTGKFIDILPAERSLKAMRDELSHLVETLSAKE